jgi:hypothetical protein
MLRVPRDQLQGAIKLPTPKSIFDKEKAKNYDPKLIVLNTKNESKEEISDLKEVP